MFVARAGSAGTKRGSVVRSMVGECRCDALNVSILLPYSLFCPLSLVLLYHRCQMVRDGLPGR